MAVGPTRLVRWMQTSLREGSGLQALPLAARTPWSCRMMVACTHGAGATAGSLVVAARLRAPRVRAVVAATQTSCAGQPQRAAVGSLRIHSLRPISGNGSLRGRSGVLRGAEHGVAQDKLQHAEPEDDGDESDDLSSSLTC